MRRATFMCFVLAACCGVIGAALMLPALVAVGCFLIFAGLALEVVEGRREFHARSGYPAEHRNRTAWRHWEGEE